MDIQFGDIAVEEGQLNVQEEMANLAIHNYEGGPRNEHRQQQNGLNHQAPENNVNNHRAPQTVNVPEADVPLLVNNQHQHQHQNRLLPNNHDGVFNADNADDDGRSVNSVRPRRGNRGGNTRKRLNPYDMGLRNIAFFLANIVSAQTGITRQKLQEARDRADDREDREE